MHPAVDALLRAIPWSAASTSAGPAPSVELAMRAMLSATSDQEAESAYWSIDNEVIVQGRMYESAPMLIPSLGVAIASGGLSNAAKRCAMELLAEFALGCGHEDLLDPEDVEATAQRELARLTSTLISRLWDEDVRVRRAAVEILRVLPEQAELVALAALLAEDPDPRIQQLVASFLESE